MDALNLTVRGGRVEFIYDDALVAVLEAGAATVVRASHVEPAPGGGWLADMGPSGGPVLQHEEIDWSVVCDDCARFPNRCTCVVARRPFATRAEALAAERSWLAEHRGL